MLFDQSEYHLRCEWGLPGLLRLAPAADAIIIVDVLSFSTAVDIAVARGASVLPYCWRDESAACYAAEKQATLAAVRSLSALSLSPASLRAIPPGTALVLPSPNGSTLCFGAPQIPAYTACLRNAPAVAAHLAQHHARIAVIPAGEHWDDGTLRPCLEDLLGAGALLSLLPGSRSPEAELAIAAFERFRHTLPAALAHCASGQELTEKGFPDDIALAAEYGVSAAVPLLTGDRFTDCASQPNPR